MARRPQATITHKAVIDQTSVADECQRKGPPLTPTVGPTALAQRSGADIAKNKPTAQRWKNAIKPWFPPPSHSRAGESGDPRAPPEHLDARVKSGRTTAAGTALPSHP